MKAESAIYIRHFFTETAEFFRSNVNARSTCAFTVVLSLRRKESARDPPPLLPSLSRETTPCATHQRRYLRIQVHRDRNVVDPIFQKINPFRRATRQEPEKKKKKKKKKNDEVVDEKETEERWEGESGRKRHA